MASVTWGTAGPTRAARPFPGQRGVGGWVSAVALALAVVGPIAAYHAFYAVANSRQFLVRDVEVSGNHIVPTSAILQAAGLDHARNILTCREAEIAAAIDAIPWVAGVEVRLGAERSIQIRIEESSLAFVAAAGALTMVDRRGEIIGEWTGEEPGGRPFVTGVTADDAGEIRLDGESVDAVLRLIEAFAASRLSETYSITDIDWDGVHGYTVALDSNLEVRLGADRLDARLSRLDETLRELQRLGRRARVVRVDGERLDRIAVETESGARDDRTAMERVQ